MTPGGARRLVTQLTSVLADGGEAVLATIVRTEGSTYRKPGAQMLVAEGGATIGLVSGGCLESLIADEAKSVLARGEPRLLYYDLMADEEYLLGYGKGCFGRQWILLEPVTPARAPASAAMLSALCDVPRRTGVALVYEVEGRSSVPVGSRVAVDEAGEMVSDILGTPDVVKALAAHVTAGFADGKALHGQHLLPTGGRLAYCVHYVPPPLELLLFGAGPDALPVAAFAAHLGWDVRVFDHRAAFAQLERIPGAVEVHCYDPDQIDRVVHPRRSSAAVIMTHNLLVDARVLRWAAEHPQLGYVGLLGPKHRRERLFTLLKEDDHEVEPLLKGRLHSPIGLDIGGDNEHDIALAIIAEVQAFRNGRAARPSAFLPFSASAVARQGSAPGGFATAASTTEAQKSRDAEGDGKG